MKADDDTEAMAYCTADALTLGIEYARRAPSTHNTQPWHFRIDHSAIDVRADRSRALSVIDPAGRELTMSCGAAIDHFRIAMGHFGYEASIELLPDGDDIDLMARIQVGASVAESAEDRRLFDAIGVRHTYRGPFGTAHPTDGVMVSLASAAQREGAWFAWEFDPATRDGLIDLIALADRVQDDDPLYRDECSRSPVPNHRVREGTGCTAPTLGDEMTRLTLPVAPRFEMPDRRANRDRHLASSAPVLAVLGSTCDRPIDWLMAGLALDRVLLLAAEAGLSVSYFSSPLQVRHGAAWCRAFPDLRTRVVSTIAASGFAQVVIGLGYAAAGGRSPRRTLSNVMQ